MFRNILALFKQSAIYGMGAIFERLLAFLMLPFFTNTFAQTEFGVYVLWFSYLTLASPGYLLGLNSALIRFYAATDNRQEQKAIFSTCYWTVLGLASLLSIVLFGLARPLTPVLFDPQVKVQVIFYLIAVLGLDSLNLLMLNLLKAENRAFTFTAISVGSGILFPGLTIFFVVTLKQGVNGALLATLITALVKCGCLHGFVVRDRLSWQFSKDWLQKMLRFGLPFVPSVLGAALLVSLDRIFLEKYWGQAVVGLYGAGSRLAMIISLMTKAFQYAWEPFLTATYRQPEAPRLYSKIFTYFVGILGVIYLGVTLFVEELVRLRIGTHTFFGPEYYASTTVVPLLMLGAVLYGIYLHFTIGIYVQQKSIFFLVVTAVGVVLNLLANWLFIPKYGMLGAAWANVLAFGGMLLVMFGLNQKYFPVPYEFLRLGKLILVLSGTWLASTCFGGFHSPGLKFGFWLLIPLWLGLLNFYEKAEFQPFKLYLKGKLWQNSRS